MGGGGLVSCNITLNWFLSKNPFPLMTRSFGQFTLILKIMLLENWSAIKVFPQKLAGSHTGLFTLVPQMRPWDSQRVS